MSSKFDLGHPKNHLIQLLMLAVLVIVIPFSLWEIQSGNFDVRPSAKQGLEKSWCDYVGADCVPNESCAARNGYELGTYSCTNNKVCCFPENSSSRLDYSGDKISVRTICGDNGNISLFILDDGVDEYPDGTWTYIITSEGKYGYIAYTGVHNSNSGGAVYVSTVPNWGSEKITLEEDTSYTAGIAHGSYDVANPTLKNPKYELQFRTPVCK